MGYILYGIALILFIYIVVDIIRTGKFDTSDKIAVLGIVLSIIFAQRTSPINIFGNTTPESSPNTTPTPITNSTPFSSSTIYDDFNNPLYDGTFNNYLWRQEEAQSGVVQSNGIIGIIGGSSLNAREYDFIELISPTFFQANIMFALGQEGGNPGDNVHFKITATTLGGEYIWFTECNIHHVSDSQAESDCWSTDKLSQSGHVYGSQKTLINFETWHTVRIEIIPSTMAFTYFLDDQNIGSQIPTDSELLKKARFTLNIGVAGPSTETGYFDNIEIGGVK